MRTRFAPSPSGPLHVGHLYAAWEALQLAAREGGECWLRLEDIDTRCKPQWSGLMHRDLDWLGLHFEGEQLIQSEHFARYEAALAQLRDKGVLYPCFCTRAQMKQQLLESGRAPHEELGYQYEGLCRTLCDSEREARIARGDAHAWRLDMGRADDLLGELHWEDSRCGVQRSRARDWGDPVLARKEFPASYHLCVVVDDAYQSMTDISRGEDLFAATHIHRVLQGLLGLETPRYHHHLLLRDEGRKRLAKRDGARSIESLRQSGWTAADVKASLQRAWENGGIWQI